MAVQRHSARRGVYLEQCVAVHEYAESFAQERGIQPEVRGGRSHARVVVQPFGHEHTCIHAGVAQRLHQAVAHHRRAACAVRLVDDHYLHRRENVTYLYPMPLADVISSDSSVICHCRSGNSGKKASASGVLTSTKVMTALVQ